ncbi:MAG: hypothetical protein JXA60_11085 [Candidatus Coatesbacteria bacterium]|nr:hypothetical protein [Candidatus Coatesbacteria bacterium]
MKVELLVFPKITDTTIYTARTTLYRIGWKGKLLDLSRATFYKFEGEFKSIKDLKNWLSLSNHFINPNKHLYKIVSGFEKHQKYDGWTRIIILYNEILPSLKCAGIEVYNIMEQEVYFAKWSAIREKDALKSSLLITRSESRESGLLANPHLQTWQIYSGRELCILE